MTDRVIKEYEPRKFETVYVVQVFRNGKWEDHGQFSGVLATFVARSSASEAAYNGLKSRVVERQVEL